MKERRSRKFVSQFFLFIRHDVKMVIKYYTWSEYLIGRFVKCAEVEIGIDQYQHENCIFGLFFSFCL